MQPDEIDTTAESTATSEPVEWPSEEEVFDIDPEEVDLFMALKESIERKPNRAQRRQQAREHLGRETRLQLHGFGRWRKARTR